MFRDTLAGVVSDAETERSIMTDTTARRERRRYVPPRGGRRIPADAAGCERGCALYERRGICPMARDAYGLQNSAEAERRAEQFRAAIAQQAQTIPSLPELVRREARLLPASTHLGLHPAPADPLYHDSRKDALHAAIPRRSK